MSTTPTVTEKKNVVCVICGKPAKWACDRCKRTFYCSIECQMKDWKEKKHNDVCIIGQVNRFGFAILKCIMDEQAKKNKKEQAVIVSPLSLALAFSMLVEGATREGLKELERWVTTDGEATRKDVWKEIMPKGAGSIANSIWLHGPPKDETTLRTYSELVKKKYAADVLYPMSMKAINTWVSKNTDGMIPGILDRDPRKDILLILINALWFSCLWLEPFEMYRTMDSDFYGPLGVRTCKMMNTYGKNIGAVDLGNGVVGSVLRLSDKYMKAKKEGELTVSDDIPVDKRNPSRLVVVFAVHSEDRTKLPTLKDAENVLAQGVHSKRLGELYVPRTKIDVLVYDELIDCLKGMGIKSTIGQPGHLEGISKEAFVSGVVHVTKFEFDERGARGAAVTAIMVAETAMPSREEPIVIRCDHPFFAGVADSETGMFILSGYIYYPTKK